MCSATTTCINVHGLKSSNYYRFLLKFYWIFLALFVTSPSVNMHVSGKIESPVKHRLATMCVCVHSALDESSTPPFPAARADSPRSADWSWRLELECCERKILLGWLELELVAGVVWEKITVVLEARRPAEHSVYKYRLRDGYKSSYIQQKGYVISLALKRASRSKSLRSRMGRMHK